MRRTTITVVHLDYLLWPGATVFDCELLELFGLALAP